MKILYWAYPDLKVCSTCFRLYGIGLSPWKRYGERLYWQRCSCDDKAEPPENITEKQAVYGNGLVELCYCCGMALVPLGSQWFMFFCDECRPMVRDFDRQYGRVIIPIGRHSLVNGSILRGLDSTGDGLILRSPDVQDDAKVEQYFSKVKGMFASIKYLEEWNRLEVANRLKEIGRVGDIPLLDYRLRSPVVDRPETFGRLVDFFSSV